MDLKQTAEYLGVTERTASNWRRRGAPIHDLAEMVEWLKTNRRHTKLSTQAVMSRRENIAARCRAFLQAYVKLTESLEAPLQSDWECILAANLTQLDPVMENLVMTLNPELAIAPDDRKNAERLHSEAWPLTGSEN